MADPATLIAVGTALLSWFNKRKAAKDQQKALREQFRVSTDRDRLTPLQNELRAGILRSFGFPEGMLGRLTAPPMEPDYGRLAPGPGTLDLVGGLAGATRYLPSRGDDAGGGVGGVGEPDGGGAGIEGPPEVGPPTPWPPPGPRPGSALPSGSDSGFANWIAEQLKRRRESRSPGRM